MKIYHTESVLDAALNRIRWLFNEFEEVVVGVSGGKDSTVLFDLTFQVAKELGRLPLSVMWIDQEIEWQATVDTVEKIMTTPGVRPYWFQIPIFIKNNTSTFSKYNKFWDPEREGQWVREKHPLAIHENRYGSEDWYDMFEYIFRVEMAGKKACYVAGMRTEETPKRFVGLTHGAKYKWVPWARRLSRKLEHYTFYPIYDWSISDVWAHIFKNGLHYNPVYDAMYQHGVAPFRMRISCLHHETSVRDLMLVQEIEPQTWVKIADRVAGANTIKHLKDRAFSCPGELPFMFKTWDQYAEHLIDKMVPDPTDQEAVRKKMAKLLETYEDEPVRTEAVQAVIGTVLLGDFDWTKIVNFEMAPEVYGYRRWHRGDEPHPAWLDNKYIPEHVKPALREALKGKANE